jgi:hypothetical protein
MKDEEFQEVEVLKDQPEKSVEVSKNLDSNTSVSTLPDFKNMDNMLAWAETIHKSNLMPTHIKKPQDIIAAVLMGNELGLAPFVAINNIYNFSGKASLGLHIYTALAIKNKVTWKVVKDFQSIYSYSDSKNNTYDEKYVNENKAMFQIVPFPFNNVPNGFTPIVGKIVVSRGKAIDVSTVIELTRNLNGQITTVTSTFNWSDAITRELATKDNWVKMPKVMMFTRCLSNGIRIIGSDFILGLPEVSEMAEQAGVTIELDENGNVVKK